MPAEPEVTLDQVRDILEMLRRTIEGASDLARRVETLEKASQQSLGLIERLQGNQEKIMVAFERHADLQNKLNTDLSQAVTQLMERLDSLEGRRRQVM